MMSKSINYFCFPPFSPSHESASGETTNLKIRFSQPRWGWGEPETLTADPQAWGPALSCAARELKLQEHKMKKLNQ